MNDHFQGNIYNCFSVRACGSDCVSECSWREVDCILFGMFHVEKKNNRSWNHLYFRLAFIYCQALCDCHPAAEHRQCSTTAQQKVKASITELRLTFSVVFRHSEGRNPKLWPTHKHTVQDKGAAVAVTARSRPLFFLSAQTPWTHFFFK